MAAEMLLINPRTRPRKARKSSTKRRTKRRTVRAANPAPRRIRRRTRRHHNPISAVRSRVMHRRVRRSGRRRNPISLGSSSQWMAMIKNAAIGGAGSVAMDVLMGYINPHLPTSMQRTPGTLGVGDAVKLALTIAAGAILNKPTKGLASKMAQGALIVQFAEAMRTFVPATMSLGGPSPMIRGMARVGPNSRALSQFRTGSPVLNGRGGMGAFIPGGASLLSNNSLGSTDDVRLREGQFVR